MLIPVSKATYVVEEYEFVCPSTFVFANGIKGAMIRNGRDHLLNEQHHEATTQTNEKQIIHSEEPLQLKGLSILHQQRPSKHNCIIAEQYCCSLLERRERCVIKNEHELIRLIAHDRLEDFFEK